jgi:hypothetical protein
MAIESGRIATCSHTKRTRAGSSCLKLGKPDWSVCQTGWSGYGKLGARRLSTTRRRLGVLYCSKGYSKNYKTKKSLCILLSCLCIKVDS